MKNLKSIVIEIREHIALQKAFIAQTKKRMDVVREQIEINQLILDMPPRVKIKNNIS